VLLFRALSGHQQKVLADLDNKNSNKGVFYAYGSALNDQ